jgi:hypothetical protein
MVNHLPNVCKALGQYPALQKKKEKKKKKKLNLSGIRKFLKIGLLLNAVSY